MYSWSSNSFQTNSLYQFKLDDVHFTGKAKKSLSEIYAPQKLFFSKPSKIRNRAYQHRKRMHNTVSTRKGSSTRTPPQNLLYHWLPKIKNSPNQLGSGDTGENKIEDKLFYGKRGVIPTANQQEFNGETLVSKYAKMKQNVPNEQEQKPNQISSDNEDNASVKLSQERQTDGGEDTSSLIPEKDKSSNGIFRENSKKAEERELNHQELTQQNEHLLLNEGLVSPLPEKESPKSLVSQREQQISSDINFEFAAIIELEEAYKNFYKLKDEIEMIKEVLGNYKDEPLSFEKKAEYKQQEIKLMDKLSELDIIRQKLVHLGEFPWPTIDKDFLADLDLDLLMGCKLTSTSESLDNDIPKLNFGFEEAREDLFINGRKIKYTSPFTLKDTLKQTDNLNTIFNDGFELPKVVMCQTGENFPKVLSCNPNKKLNIKGVKYSWPYPKMADSMDEKNEVVICLTDRLKESYTIQEKLVAENASLEDFRYQLEEEVLAKEQAIEDYKRKCCQLQNELKLLVWENKKLNEKLEPKPVFKKEFGKKIENNLLSRLENQVKSLQKDLELVHAARREADRERSRIKDAAISMQARPVTSPLPQIPPDRNNEKILQLKEQYARVKEDYNTKVSQVAALQVENQNLLTEIDEKAKNLKEADELIKDLQEKLSVAEKDRTVGSKGQVCQVLLLEQQLREAKDELEELNIKQQESAYQEEYYRGKYLLAQQQVEEQRRQIDLMDADNKRITLQVEEEMQRVKCQFQEKLDELKSLPELLRSTQCRLQDAFQKQKLSDEKICELTGQLEEANNKKLEAEQKLERFWSQHDEMINQYDSLKAKVEAWEKKCKDLQDINSKHNNDMKRLEECATQYKRGSEEKGLEIMQLNSQLENMREESARQIAKTKDRSETLRRSYQAQVEELERQLAQSRATAHAAQAERDEIRKRMQCHINNLSENFEQAQSRIRYLQSHVNHLTSSFTNVTEDNSSAFPDMGGFCDCD